MKLEDFALLQTSIEQALQQKTPIIIAIEGRSGSGKSSLAEKLGKLYDCNIISMDDFFLQPAQRSSVRLAEAGGNVAYERLQAEVLLPLLAGKSFSYQPFDCLQQRFKDAKEFPIKPLNIIEGVYSLHPTLSYAYDLKIFMTVDAEEQQSRIIKRSGFVKWQRFAEEWIPLEEAYFRATRTEEKCDVVISNLQIKSNLKKNSQFTIQNS
ncbi:MAG: uridine kinase [Clostridia bacterium]